MAALNQLRFLHLRRWSRGLCQPIRKRVTRKHVENGNTPSSLSPNYKTGIQSLCGKQISEIHTSQYSYNPSHSFHASQTSSPAMAFFGYEKYLDPKNDIAFKRLFGTERNKEILVHFLNDVLEHEDDNQIKDVQFLSPDQDTEVAYNKDSIVDILCKVSTGAQFIVHIWIMNSPMTEGFEEDVKYYAAKAYASYQNVKEIIFIVIADCSLSSTNELEFKSKRTIRNFDIDSLDRKDFTFTYFELPKFEKTKDQLSNAIDRWLYFFKYAGETAPQEVERIIGRDDRVIKKAFQELNKFNWDYDDLSAYERVVECALEEAAAFAKIKDGRHKIGEKKRKIYVAEKMLKHKSLTVEFIARTVKLPEAEILQLKELAQSCVAR